MRVGELSRRTGVSVPSIKYYLREGMLPGGERTGPNQAAYDEGHVRRLRLVRALLDVGGLSVAAARDVLATVDDDTAALHEVLGTAQGALHAVREPLDDEPAATATAVVEDLIARRGWRVGTTNPGRLAAADVLATLERLDAHSVAGLLETYADAADLVAPAELDAVVAPGDPETSVEKTVMGIVLGGALLLALRAMAEESVSAQRLAPS